MFIKINHGKITLDQKMIALRHTTSIFTPDMAVLEKYQYQLLFVCDAWMSDRRDNHEIDDLDGKRKGRAFTFNKFKYLVQDRDLFSECHRPLPLEYKDYGYKISGEIVAVRPHIIKDLDKFKLNERMFLRKRVHVLYPYRDEIVYENTLAADDPGMHPSASFDMRTRKFEIYQHPLAGKKRWLSEERLCILRVWMYVANPEFWKDIIRNPFNYSEVPTFKPKKSKRWLSEYYRYQSPKREME